jgi:hypothetical protein
MENQVQIAIDAGTGNILIAVGPMMRFALDIQSALGFMAGLSTVLAQHPRVQPKPGPQILIAGALPQLADSINPDGH